MSDRDAMNRLRAIAARLLERHDPDAEWFGACVQEYVAGARHGRSLADVFGLTVRAGARPWWVLEALEARTALLRELRQRHFPALDGRPAVAAIVAAISRYETGGWRRDRKFVNPPPDPLRAHLFALLKLGVPLGASTIRRALDPGSGEGPIREPAPPAA